MTKRDVFTKCILAVGVVAAFALAGCADDGYGRRHEYTSMSVGVSSYDHPYHRSYRDEDRDGIPNRYDYDRDGDGVPNRFDDAPRDPYRY